MAGIDMSINGRRLFSDMRWNVERGEADSAACSSDDELFTRTEFIRRNPDDIHSFIISYQAKSGTIQT